MKILLVDDHAGVRDTFSVVLSDAGHEVALASNGQEALELIFRAEEPPSLIICDIEMPIMDGARFITIIRAYVRFAGVPVIMVTGSKGAASGIEPHLYQRLLIKPIAADVLLDTVRDFGLQKTVVG